MTPGQFANWCWRRLQFDSWGVRVTHYSDGILIDENSQHEHSNAEGSTGGIAVPYDRHVGAFDLCPSTHTHIIHMHWWKNIMICSKSLDISRYFSKSLYKRCLVYRFSTQISILENVFIWPPMVIRQVAMAMSGTFPRIHCDIPESMSRSSAATGKAQHGRLSVSIGSCTPHNCLCPHALADT